MLEFFIIKIFSNFPQKVESTIPSTWFTRHIIISDSISLLKSCPVYFAHLAIHPPTKTWSIEWVVRLAGNFLSIDIITKEFSYHGSSGGGGGNVVGTNLTTFASNVINSSISSFFLSLSDWLDRLLDNHRHLIQQH